MQYEESQHAFGVAPKPLMLIAHSLGRSDFHQFSSVELVHPDSATRLAARRTGFSTETGCICHELFRKLVKSENLIAIEIRQLDFSSWREEKLVFFQTIHIGFELRELRRADHAIAPD